MEKPTFVYTIWIGTTPDKLWAALTQGEFTKQYWGGSDIQSDWKVGSKVMVTGAPGGGIRGEVLRCEAPKTLSYTFLSERSEGERPSRVTFELSPRGPAVALTITHDDFDAGSKSYEGVSQGWPGILSNLKSLLETGKPLFTKWG
jgi:uncharacterized protein YndB with AHSA1/START domain